MDNFAIIINTGEASKNLKPVAKMGGIVATAIFMASQVVPQVSDTRIKSVSVTRLLP
ncbi:hypothetical protein D3C71_2171890 [compost metagenome]